MGWVPADEDADKHLKVYSGTVFNLVGKRFRRSFSNFIAEEKGLEHKQ